jgi:hypothetical protein
MMPTSDYVESLDFVGPNPLLIPRKDEGRGDFFVRGRGSGEDRPRRGFLTRCFPALTRRV